MDHKTFDTDERVILARKMIARRGAAGLTQDILAKRAEVRVETISRLENAKHIPRQKTVDKLNKAMGYGGE